MSKKVSPFASYHRKTLTKLPCVGADESVVIRKLNDELLAEAAAAVQTKLLQSVEKMGGMNIVNLITAIEDKAAGAIDADMLAQAKAAQAARVEAIKKDPYLAYDRNTLLVLGIVSWTLQDPDNKPVKVTAESIADLPPKMKDKIAREIYDHSAPEEDDVKNESAPSSVN